MGKKGQQSNGDDTPLWLITFSDLMTLMLTFFVLLVSMSAVLDEEKKKLALGSVTGTFGIGDHGMSVLSTRPQTRTTAIEPGPLEDVSDLSSLKGLAWEESGPDVRFLSNAFIQILSINSEVLFAPGNSTLRSGGEDLLDRILPELRQVGYPLLLSGHTSSLRDEVGLDYMKNARQGVDPSWQLSLERVQAVYRYLIQGGMDPERLRMEGHGRFMPRYTNTTPEGRSKNRRVDLVLDKRNYMRRPFLRSTFPRGWGGEKSPLMYRDFIFDVDSGRNGTQ